MSTLGAFLTAAAGPIAKKVLTSLGIGVVSFVGLQALLSELLGFAKDAWGGMPAIAAAYMAIGGANTAISIIAGALITRVSLVALRKLDLL